MLGKSAGPYLDIEKHKSITAALFDPWWGSYCETVLQAGNFVNLGDILSLIAHKSNLGRAMQFVKSSVLLVLGTLFVSNLASAVSSNSDQCPAILDFRFALLLGNTQDLCQYRGKVVLVVNTASYCGYTEQYKGLQALHDKYQKRGLVVLGFPANDFGKQEPGSNAEVADFCERTFKVKFPIIEKTSVVAVAGRPANPVYEALFKATGERPQWNFHKFLVARDGATVKSFSSRVAPESDAFKAEVEALLVAK